MYREFGRSTGCVDFDLVICPIDMVRQVRIRQTRKAAELVKMVELSYCTYHKCIVLLLRKVLAWKHLAMVDNVGIHSTVIDH